MKLYIAIGLLLVNPLIGMCWLRPGKIPPPPVLKREDSRSYYIPDEITTKPRNGFRANGSVTIVRIHNSRPLSRALSTVGFEDVDLRARPPQNLDQGSQRRCECSSERTWWTWLSWFCCCCRDDSPIRQSSR